MQSAVAMPARQYTDLQVAKHAVSYFFSTMAGIHQHIVPNYNAGQHDKWPWIRLMMNQCADLMGKSHASFPSTSRLANAYAELANEEPAIKHEVVRLSVQKLQRILRLVMTSPSAELAAKGLAHEHQLYLDQAKLVLPDAVWFDAFRDARLKSFRDLLAYLECNQPKTRRTPPW